MSGNKSIKITNIVTEYLHYYQEHTKKYEKGLVFMQVGSFYEAYATNQIGPNLYEISSLINIVKTVRDKSNPEISDKNPHMIGFPTVALDKFLSILIDNDYTVMIIDQVTLPPSPERKVTGIYSKGTYVNNLYNCDCNYIVCIYIEELNQKNGNSLLCVGLSAIDLTTGETKIHQSISTVHDDKFALDETLRFINALTPKEYIIFMGDLIKTTKDYIISYLDLDNKYCHITHKPNSKYVDLNVQNKFLKSAYSEYSNMLSPIEYLELDKMPYTVISLTIIIDFIQEHNKNLIKKLKLPQTLLNYNNLIMGNNAQYQLNILNGDNMLIGGKTKIKCLLDIINISTTPMGKRYTKNMLSSPMSDSKAIEEVYNNVDNILKGNIYKKLDEYLSNIYDIERLERKMSILSIQPYEYFQLIESLKAIIILINFVKGANIEIIGKKNDNIDVISQFIKECDEKFEYNILKNANMCDTSTSFFKGGVYKDVDVIQAKMTFGHDSMRDLSSKFSEIIRDKDKEKKNNKILGLSKDKAIGQLIVDPIGKNPEKGLDLVQIKHNDQCGYYLSLTKIRGKYLEDNLEEKMIINVKGDFVEKHDIIFKYLKNNCNITLPYIQDHSNEIIKLKNELGKLIQDYFKNIIETTYQRYGNLIRALSNYVTKVDYYVTIAKCAQKYNYVRPKILQVNSEQHGYINAKNLRHPIVEKIIDYEYVPHDVNIGRDIKGMMLYSLNSLGKSVLMKAVGIATTMAQAGFFVPAAEFTYYPYEAIYTRITGNDNLFKGLSSFGLEMVELNSIIKRAGPKTLILGDEICRGTEHISGNAIVATTLMRLSDVESTFIFATHLHEIMDLDDIKKRTNIRAFHMNAEYDHKSDTIVYDRKIKEGCGERVYGITVAKNIIRDATFIQKANEIKEILLNKYNTQVSGNKSNYNSDKLIDKCEICGIENKLDRPILETHHIKFQKDFDENNFHKESRHVQKNAIYNLVGLCSKCHDKVHNGQIDVEGYKMTDRGNKLFYKKNNDEKEVEKEVEKIIMTKDISTNVEIKEEIKKKIKKQVKKGNV